MACADAAQTQSQRMGHMTRRGFLRVGGLTVAALAAADPLGWVMPEVNAAAATSSPGPGGAPRRLIVLELNGGNDGLNTLIPYGLGRYYDLRARVGGQVTFVHGVGVERIADLSHFSMQALWRAGDQDGALSGASGWAGRLVTALGGVAAPVGGLSIASAPSPLILDAGARTAAAADAYQGQFAFPDGQADRLRRALAAMSQADSADAPLLGMARHGLDGTFAIHDMCASLGDPASGYPASDLGRALAFSAQLLGAQPGLRVIHVPVPLDFDTHEGQPRRQAANLAAIDTALEALLTDLQRRGLAASTAIMATSEFGRRVAENGSLGSDHGGANTLFVMAPGMRAPMVGTPPALERLDDDGNLVPTLSYRDYLATAIEGWLGVPAGTVLSGSRPLSLWS